MASEGDRGEDDRSPGSVRAVERAVDILESFTPEHPSLSVLELKRRTGLSRPTLYRLLGTLVARHLVKAEGEPQRFSLDHGVATLARSWAAHLDIVRVAEPILEALREDTGETVSLLIFQNDALLSVRELPSRHGLAISRGLGHMKEELWQGASGRAVLANLGDTRARRILETLPVGAERQRVEAALERTRADGVSVSYGEVLVGTVAMAAPIFDHAGAVVGTVGAYGPEARLDGSAISNIAARVRLAAATVSAGLGWKA